MAAAVRIRSFGGPEVMELIEVPEPTAPDDGVVIAVRAAGVNPLDWKIRKGLTSSAPLESPIGLGSDAAGVVVAVGSHAERFEVGDEVIARGLTGAYASQVTAAESQVVTKPGSLGWEKAAGLGIPAGTAYQVLRAVGYSAGETLLVHAGSGAVGQAAIQFARHWGLTVVATGSPANHDRLRELGAVPVEYGPGLLERLRAAAARIDLVLDAAGTEEALASSLALVADRSRIVTIVAYERAGALGIHAYSENRPGGLDDAGRALRTEGVAVAADLAANGNFDVEIARVFALDQVADAHRLGESGRARGKIVLVPASTAKRNAD